LSELLERIERADQVGLGVPTRDIAK